MSLLGGVRGRATAAAYSAGWRLVRLLPQVWAERAFRTGADYGFRRNGKGVRRLRHNLRRVVGPGLPETELDLLVQQALRSYARYWMETFRLPGMDKQDVLARTETEGSEHLDAAYAAGNGVIVALPHTGNWDVAGLWLIERGVPFTTVAERLEPASLFDRFVAYREGLGMQIVPLSGGERAPMDILRERLAAGGCVCLVAERDLSERGVEIEFFGETARFPPGPALLAAQTGAALLPVCLYYTDNGWGQWIGPAIAVPPGRLREQVAVATQDLANAFAARISLHPADWHMLQKLWVADLTVRS